MPRTTTPAVLAALTSQYLKVGLLLDITFVTGTVYVWTGAGNLSWGGNTYPGVGVLGNVTVIEEATSIEARGITLNLSGLQTSILADVLQEMKLGAPVILRMALFDGSNVIIPDPLVSWAGRTDQPSISADGATSQLAINCENRLLSMNVPVNRRYTQDDQQMGWPGDTGLQFASSIIDQTIYWGAGANATNL